VVRSKTSEMKSLFPFLAAFCHGLIIPFTTFDLKSVKGKGQTFQGAGVRSPPRFPTGAELGMPGGIPGLSNVVSRDTQEERERERERARSILFTVSWATATEKWGWGCWGGTAVGSEGGCCQGSHPRPSLVGLYFFFPSQILAMAKGTSQTNSAEIEHAVS